MWILLTAQQNHKSNQINMELTATIIVLQPYCTTPLQVLFGLEPSTLYSIRFFTQSLSSFRNTCPYHRNLFCCITEIMSSIPSLSLNSLLGTLSFTLMSHIHQTMLVSDRKSATSFSVLAGQVSLSCNILLRTQLLFSFPLIMNKMSILLSNGTNCLNLFQLTPDLHWHQ